MTLNFRTNSFTQRVGAKALFGAAMAACALWSAAGAWHGDTAAPVHAATAPAELPATWQGVPVRPLALSAVEQRFAERFPGHIARLTDGRQIVVLREVRQPTRMLHPAADCYRALGYRIEEERLEHVAATDSIQRCFTARQPGVALRVCEQIDDAQGNRFADASAWYWAAVTGRSPGPWRAVTVTRPWGAHDA